MSTSTPVFSLKGQSLKCDSADSVQSHLEPLVADQDVQVVVFGGNTFGIGACEQIAVVLKTKEKLQVRLLIPPPPPKEKSQINTH